MATSSERRFPVKAALALLAAVALLAGAHFYRDRSKGISPRLFADAVRFHWPRRPRPAGPPNVAPTVTTKAKAPGVPAPISAVMADDALAMDPFYAQLYGLETGKPQVVTVLHYGDSPTTADLITGDVRARLQTRFGDAGHGFNLPAKPWAWYSHREVELHDKGWDTNPVHATGVGRMKQGSYGLGGATIVGSVGAHSEFRLAGAAQTGVQLTYLAGPAGGTFTVGANNATLASVDTHADAVAPMVSSIDLPAATRSVTLDVVTGTVTMYGVDFRRGNTGVLYDSMGLNGATTTVLSRTVDPAAWKLQLAQTRPSLIVINYGTNESQFHGLVQTLDKELRTAIDRTRASAPGVPILIMSPMDRGQRSRGDIVTNMEIPAIVAIQQRVAVDMHCAFFNTYAAMGGDGTMGRWYAAQPRLVTADFIHPTPQGAAIVAGYMIDNLYLGYDRWKRMHGIAVGPGATHVTAPIVPVVPAHVPAPALVIKLKPSVARPMEDAPKSEELIKDAPNKDAPKAAPAPPVETPPVVTPKSEPTAPAPQ